MNKVVFVCVLFSIIFFPSGVNAYDNSFTQSSLNMGGENIYTTPIYSDNNSPEVREVRSYTGSVTSTYNPMQQPNIVINNNYPAVYPYYGGNYVTTYRIGPYYPYSYYPYNTNNIGFSTSVRAGGSNFSYNYSGHGFNYGVTSGAPIYTNRTVYAPARPLPPPNHNMTPHPKPGSATAGFHYKW